MVRDALEAEGYAHYVAQLRNGTADAYVAYRVFEKPWHVLGRDRPLLRRATKRLIESDPWFLATATVHFLDSLESDDLEDLTQFVGAGPARRAAAMLRARLWYHARRGPFRVDAAGRDQLRRALSFLKRVPKDQRDTSWHDMLVGCYRVLDYAKYVRAFPKLLASTPPNWRAFPLHRFLDVVASKKDWDVYDRHRAEWDRLPPGHHACECYVNAVHTDDGLRAAASRNWETIPDALTKAADVRGCPHLNSGGMRLDLVRLLLAKKKHLGPARKYLERAAAFGHGTADVTKLRQRLDHLEETR